MIIPTHRHTFTDVIKKIKSKYLKFTSQLLFHCWYNYNVNNKTETTLSNACLPLSPSDLKAVASRKTWLVGRQLSYKGRSTFWGWETLPAPALTNLVDPDCRVIWSWGKRLKLLRPELVYSFVAEQREASCHFRKAAWSLADLGPWPSHVKTYTIGHFTDYIHVDGMGLYFPILSMNVATFKNTFNNVKK